MSEFWTKTCEKCHREFDVGLWTHETTLCNICKIEEDLDPLPDTFEGHMKGIRESWRDISIVRNQRNEAEQSKEYTAEDFKEMIQDPYWGRKKKDRE